MQKRSATRAPRLLSEVEPPLAAAAQPGANDPELRFERASEVKKANANGSFSEMHSRVAANKGDLDPAPHGQRSSAALSADTCLLTMEYSKPSPPKSRQKVAPWGLGGNRDDAPIEPPPDA